MKIYIRTLVLFILISALSIFSALSLYFLYSQARYNVTKNFEYKLAGIGKTVSCLVDLQEAKGVLDLDNEKLKESALYMKYHSPLAQILEEAQASYLYIFNYGGEEDILYLIDGEAFDDDSRSAPNDTEESVEEDLYKGLYNAFRGEDGVSPLFHDPDFGYMISGTYPILEGEEKRSFYMTGVDISLNEIVQTLISLLTKSILLFVGILIFMIFLTRIFSDRISKSILKVINETLKLSAIESHILDTKSTPKEFLSVVNQISQYAKDSSNKLKEMKLERDNILDKKSTQTLSDYLKDSSDLKAYQKLNDTNFFYGAFNFLGNIYAYSFPKSEVEDEDILKSFALKNKIREYAKNDDISILIKELSAYAVFDLEGKIIKAKNDDISIVKEGGNLLISFNNKFKFLIK